MLERKNNRVLITGSAGLLGTALLNKIVPPYDVLGIYFRTEPEAASTANLHFEKADLTNADTVAKLIEKYGPDTIINSAGWVDVDGCESDNPRAKESNFLIVKNIVDAIHSANIYLIQISTDYIFDGRDHPGKIDDQPAPLNYYGYTKLLAEEYIKKNLSYYMNARTCALMGSPRLGRTNLINYFYDKLGSNQEVMAPDDLYANPIWVDNLAELILESVQKKIRGVTHLGGADYLSRYEFARLLAEVFGFDAELIRPLSASSQNRPARRPQYAGLDITATVPQFRTKFLSVREALTRIRNLSV